MLHRSRRRHARRNFGIASPRKARRARRNRWSEKKSIFKSPGVSWTIAKAPKHHAAAKLGWSNKRAGTKTVVVVAKAAPKKSRRKAGRKSRPAKKGKARRSSRKSVRKNSRSRRRRVVFLKRNPIRRRRHLKRNPHRKLHRRSRRNAGHRKLHRRSRRNRRNGPMNGVMAWLPKIGVAALALGGAAFVGSKLSEYVSKQMPTLSPQMKEYLPAVVTGVAGVGLYMLAQKLKAPAQFMNFIAAGSALAAVVQLAAHVKMANGQTLAQYAGLPWAGTDAPAPAAAAVSGFSGYGVFGLGAPKSNYGMYGLNGYSPMQLSGAVDIDGRALAVEGVVSVPGGGALAVDGLGGYLGGTLSDSVLGTQRSGDGPAVNPFAPGIREGNRGTLNEPSAADVADMGSLSGNVFT